VVVAGGGGGATVEVVVRGWAFVFGAACSRTRDGVRFAGGVRCSLVTGTATDPRETTYAA